VQHGERAWAAAGRLVPSIMLKIDPRLAALTAGNFAHGSATMGVMGLLNEISDDLDISIAAAGQITTGMQLAAAIGAPLVAFFGGAISRRTLLVSALALTAAAQFAAALAPAFLLLLAARTVAGVGTAAYAPTAAATASHLVAPERRSSALAIVFMGFTFASIVGVPMGVWLGGLLGWRFAMTAFGALALAAMIWVAVSVPARMPAGAMLEPGAWRRVFRSRAIMAMVVFNLLQGSAQMTFYSYIAPLLRAAIDAGPGLISIALGWIGLWGVFGSVATIRLIDRLRPVRVLAIGLGGTTLAVVLWPFADGSVSFVFVLLAFWGMSSIMVFSASQAQVVHIDHRLAGAALPVFASSNFTGGFLGPAIGGIAITALGLQALPWLASALFAASAFVLAGATRAEARRG